MKLLALICPVCGTWLKPGAEDVVWPCAQCGTAVSLSEAGVQSLEVQYALTASPADDTTLTWLPFWLFNGRVHLSQRQTQSGSRGDQDAATAFWAAPRRFFVPAWDILQSQAREIGVQLLQTQPNYQAGDPPPAARFPPAILAAADALKLIEFLILTLEARRSDWLKQIEFHIEAGPATLWLLPARRTGQSWQLDAQ